MPRSGSTRREGHWRWAALGVLLALAQTALGVAAAAGATSGNTGSGSRAEAPRGARWLWPLDPPPQVVHGFEAPPGPYAAGHRGADLAATPGQAVRAPAGGLVAFAGWVAGREVLSIDHSGGLRTTYEPVQATATVGAQVRPGEVVGVVTSSPGHCLPGSCLHWGLRRDQDYLDPLRMVATGRSIRLLPLHRAVAPTPAGPLPMLNAAPWLAIGTAAGPDRGPLLAGGR